MRYPFLRALALVAGLVTALAPAARAQDSSKGAPPLTFSYYDPEATGRLYLFDLGPDAATGGHSISVMLIRGRNYYIGSGFTYQLEETMPFKTLIAFTVQGGNGVSLAYRGTTISGITLSGSGTFSRPQFPDKKLDWSIVLGGAALEKSGVQGTVVEGPVFPVERPGVVNERPLPGATIIARTLGGQEVARTRSDKAGYFKLELAPGSYRIVSMRPNLDDVRPAPEPITVIVKPGQLLDLKIRFETFIR
jgi:hypothetical protein